MRRSRIVWLLRQVLPLTYRTSYGLVLEDGTTERRFCVWRMWLGRCFDITHIRVAE